MLQCKALHAISAVSALVLEAGVCCSILKERVLWAFAGGFFSFLPTMRWVEEAFRAEKFALQEHQTYLATFWQTLSTASLTRAGQLLDKHLNHARSMAGGKLETFPLILAQIRCQKSRVYLCTSVLKKAWQCHLLL